LSSLPSFIIHVCQSVAYLPVGRINKKEDKHHIRDICLKWYLCGTQIKNSDQITNNYEGTESLDLYNSENFTRTHLFHLLLEYKISSYSYIITLMFLQNWISPVNSLSLKNKRIELVIYKYKLFTVKTWLSKKSH